MSKRKIIEEYFKSWIDNNIEIINEHFNDDVEYVESWGPAYLSKLEVQQWFRDWHLKNKVIVWDIKESSEIEDKVICEWYFKFVNSKEQVSEFNGISTIKFNEENKIIEVREYMSKLPINYPYLKRENLKASLKISLQEMKQHREGKIKLKPIDEELKD